ncbi:hypothetical protein [Herbidospora mongoliensis]|uniref:hypothetical protein n=1 Tax=Herbidospora mongoliensis TaxID=688067 RepID=UPI0008322DA3|nr:hypothetical protein [Herbidospora mongoliensis]
MESLTKSKRATRSEPSLAELLRDGAEPAFRSLESALAGAGPTVSHWPTLAAMPLVERSWLIHAAYVLRRRAAEAGPAFDRVAALARLVRHAARRTAEPGGPDGAFESEVLAVSGWQAEVLPARLRVPVSGPEARFEERPLSADLALRPPGAALAAEDPLQALDLAGQVQRFLSSGFGPYPIARPNGPLSGGYDLATAVLSSAERPAGLGAQSEELHRRTGADPDLLRRRLTADPGLSERVRHVILNSASHTGHPVYVPFAVPADGRSRLHTDLAHGLLHRLAHPGLIGGAEPSLVEALVELLTSQVVVAMGGSPGPVTPGAVELERRVGADNVRAAFFLGRIEFIGR